MIVTKGKWLKTGEVWFDQTPTSEVVDVMTFEQRAEPLQGAACTPFHTRVIDLSPDSEIVLSGFSKSNRYKIRRGGREGLELEHWFPPEFPVVEQFCDFYDDFAALKGQSSIYRDKLMAMARCGVLDLSCARDAEGEAIVWHAHVRTCSRARLLYTASLYRDSSDSGYRNMIGRANRYLHWQDMLRYKDDGVAQYDVGGWYVGDSDQEKLHINQFKAEFGGHTETSYNCVQLVSAKARMLNLVGRLFGRSIDP